MSAIAVAPPVACGWPHYAGTCGCDRGRFVDRAAAACEGGPSAATATPATVMAIRIVHFRVSRASEVGTDIG